MNIRSTRRPIPVKDPVLETTLKTSNVHEPGLMVVTAPGQPGYYAEARAYRNARLRTLTGALAKSGGTLAKAMFPAHAAKIDCLTFCVGTVNDLWRVVEDGTVSAGETIDLAARAMGSVPTIGTLGNEARPAHGPDDGLRGIEESYALFEAGEWAFGAIAKASGDHFASIAVPSRYAALAAGRDSSFADLSKGLGQTQPAIGAIASVFDVLGDPWFWKSLDLPAPATPIQPSQFQV